MINKHSLEEFAPLFQKDEYTDKEKLRLQPFFTNLDKSVYVPLILSPELIGALCSRSSRATTDLRHIFLREFIDPFLNPVRQENETSEAWQATIKYGEELYDFLNFFKDHSLLEFFANPRARSFYIKWLAQYGDDSIAQMAGTHLAFSGVSQIVIKHFEDQRIGLAPIEKSTRYVNYAQKINNQYQYYIDPTLKDIGLDAEYKTVMDNLFETYIDLLPKLSAWLQDRFPEEKKSVVEKKAFDILRGLLPMATLSQVTFFGNGQSFEHMINRSLGHSLGEVRWAGEMAYQELNKITPSFLRRIKDETRKDMIEEYQKYLSHKNKQTVPVVKGLFKDSLKEVETGPRVQLVEFDTDGEDKIITGILYSAVNNHLSWNKILQTVKALTVEEKKEILKVHLQDRKFRWQKVSRAFENIYVRFEIVMNLGAWRDLHRHRMLTQQKQNFTCDHSYDVAPELIKSKLDSEFSSAINKVEDLYYKIAQHDLELAQYATCLAHRIRFMQFQNLRECFWEIELRTIPEGHTDYRYIEQEKFKLLQKVYPLVTEYMLANLGNYDFARRGQEEKIQKKIEQLSSL